MEKFFNVHTNRKRGAPYAPTIKSNKDVYLSNCPECDRTRFNEENRDLSLVIEGYRKLPDGLLCGHYPLTIVSEKVIDIWQKYNVSGYSYFPINKLFDMKGNEIYTECKYFNVITTGRAELDFDKMNIHIISECSTCGYVEYNKETWEFGEAFYKDETYDDSDLFALKYFEKSLLCTKKILEISYKEKLTGFQFKTFASMFIYINSPPAIDLKDLFGNAKRD